MKKLLRIMILTLATSSMLLIGASVVSAAEVVDQGTCGDNLSWVLDDEGTLTISGTGEIQDCYEVVSENEGRIIGGPWSFDKVTKVVINDGVTNIGKYAFYSLENLESISIPDSVTNIDDGALSGCLQIRSISIPASVTHIGDSALSCCKRLTNLELNEGLISIDSYAFGECVNLKKRKNT